MNPTGQLFSVSKRRERVKSEWHHPPVAGDPPNQLQLGLIKEK